MNGPGTGIFCTSVVVVLSVVKGQRPSIQDLANACKNQDRCREP